MEDGKGGQGEEGMDWEDVDRKGVGGDEEGEGEEGMEGGGDRDGYGRGKGLRRDGENSGSGWEGRGGGEEVVRGKQRVTRVRVARKRGMWRGGVGKGWCGREDGGGGVRRVEGEGGREGRCDREVVEGAGMGWGKGQEEGERWVWKK